MSSKQGLQGITRQMENYLTQIDPADYQQPLEVLSGSSIGQHFRHIFDFYYCLAKGAAQDLVDYANRERDPRVESDQIFAAQVLGETMKQIAHLPEDQSVRMRADFIHLSEAERPVYPSSYGRELTFLHDHAVHHLALIKIGFRAQCPGLLTDPHFGVAPSTVRFREEQNTETSR
ncbi:MAG: hypothetical protein IPH16_10560 [Haliscomenobacter sp.]|nr:hypothetical protein [Haliscomenobacter sp.]